MNRISPIGDKEAANSRATPTVDDANWAIRSGMWRDRVEKASVRRTKRAKAHPALILAGHGVSLRIHGGALEIQNGLTHYPQRREQFIFFRRDADLPERIILLDGSGSISFDVLSWLAQQKISLIRIDWKGDLFASRARRVIRPILSSALAIGNPRKS
jgi:CRISP-associated protein Cas1